MSTNDYLAHIEVLHEQVASLRQALTGVCRIVGFGIDAPAPCLSCLQTEVQGHRYWCWVGKAEKMLKDGTPIRFSPDIVEVIAALDP